MFFKKLFNKKTNLHFIHIGKTGGSNIKSTLQNVKLDNYQLIFHPHTVRLKDIPIGEKYFFCTRDPIDRFQSGFYSRKRKGQPRYYSEWTKHEEKAFSLFSDPNELAKSLKTSNTNYENAKFAMKSITHVNSSYWDWFKNKEYFEERIDDLFFVLRLEDLNSDFDDFIKKTKNKEKPGLRTDSLSMHSNNTEYFLSEKAIRNLEEWYRQEYEFLGFLESCVK